MIATETIEVDDEQERRQRYEETERELLAVLEAESVEESTRKRQLVGLFDRFRNEYTELSVKLRESLRLQRRLMDKCLQIKNELVVCALKIKTTEQVQADEIKSLVFYRDECEYAWKQSALSQERERDAMRIIDDLKTKVEELQLQVKALVTNSASVGPLTRRRPHTEGSLEPLQSSSPLTSPKSQQTRLISPVLSPVAGTSPAKRKINGPVSSVNIPELLSFDEWKTATKVWCPATPLALGGSSRVAPTPSKDSIQASEWQQEITRCVSVPSLNPTPMERVSSPQQQQRQQQKQVDHTRPCSAIRAGTAPSVPVRASIQTPESASLNRRGGTPAIKRRVPRQLPHVQ